MRALAVFFLLLYTLAMVRPFAPYVEYAWNKKEIAATLCENRNRPEMHCNGHCYLMKRLRAAQSQSDAPAVPSAQKTIESLPIHEGELPETQLVAAHALRQPYRLAAERICGESHTAEIIAPPRG